MIHPPANVVHQELTIGAVHHEVQVGGDLGDRGTVQRALGGHPIHGLGDRQFVIVERFDANSQSTHVD